MKILILGGTGAMGVHLVNILSERAVEIQVTSRTKRKSNGKVKYIQGNAKEFSFLTKVLSSEWDVIVDFMTYTTDVFEDRVKYLLKATKQYVFLSSARVYAESKTPIVENSARLLDTSTDKEYLKTDEYALRKAKQENILMKSGFLNWTIIRPYITYSENRLQLGVLEKEDWLYRALKGRTIVFSKEINKRITTMTYGFDVAKGISSLIANEDSYGQTFQITGDESIKWSEILKIYLTVLEKKIGSQPSVLLQDTDEFVNWRLGKYQVLNDRLYDRTFDNEKISNYVDVKKFQKATVKIADCLHAFLEAPQFKEINWRKEALKDRYTKEHASLSEIKGIKNRFLYISYRYFNWLIEVVIKGIYKRIKRIFKE